MSRAKDYARQQLGNLDLSHLDKEREVASNIYNTSKQGLDTNFSNLIDQINRNRQDTRTNFNRGRGTIAENAFTQNRLNNLDLGSRIVGRSGLKELGEVGNRIETGRQYSNLANTFYSDMDNLSRTEKQGRSQYDLDQQGLTNTLNQTLAGVDSRGAESKNAYNMTLGQLAEQIQGRWDSNNNAAAALEQQKAAQTQAYNLAKEQMAQQNKALNDQVLTQIINNKDLNNDQRVTQMATRLGINKDDAINILKQYDMWSGNRFVDNLRSSLSGMLGR